VAISGTRGSGKSTLVSLIRGCGSDRRAVLVDGVDLRELDPAELRRHIGFVPQNVLFSATIAENIASAWRTLATLKRRAAEMAGLAGWKGSRPVPDDGGERGIIFPAGRSSGRRLPGAAGPSILILDDAFPAWIR
jgi:ABC-type transport system involved in cytochrome bd biosynthesis fused ATPase/permease subunit